MPSTRHLLFIPLLLVAVPGGTQPTLSEVQPAILDTSLQPFVRLQGTGLDGLSAASLQKPGTALVPLTIESQTALDCVLRGNFPSLPAGLYSIVYTDAVPGAGTFENVLELRHTPDRLVSGTPAGGIGLPLFSGFTLSNTEFILLSAEIGRAGTVDELRFYPESGATPPTGTMILRLKETASTSFASNNLESTGWTDVYTGPIPAMTPGQPYLVPFALEFAYGGTQNLAVSMVLDVSNPASGDWLRDFDSGANRLRAGIAASSGTPPEDWSGGTPTFRQLGSEVPEVAVLFTDVAVTAQFMVSETTVAVGEPITFTDQSIGSPTAWAWDFDGDGTVDSTQQNPTHSYATAGVYTVVLTASTTHASDAETKLAHITITPESAVVNPFLIVE